VSGFRFDKYLVTVGRFRQFVEAVFPPDGGTGWLPPAGSGKHTHLNGGQGLANGGSAGSYESGWATSDDGNIAPTDANLTTNCDYSNYATWTSSAGSQENLPINCVNWYEAQAFCIWDGGFLPSEAEGEYAAAGGSQQREYPWGSTSPGTPCPGAGCQYAIFACYYPGGSVGCSGVSNIAPVGTATSGAGLWGQLDLVGEVWEWGLDWYSANYADPCTDCAVLTASSQRVVRGGTFSSGSAPLQASYGYGTFPDRRSYGFGLRCARSP
jgi:formylglycine-generating enzyme required for sulfatase activity